MSNRRKILIFTSNTGSGHVSLAEALRERLEHLYEIEVVNALPDVFRQHYNFVSRHARWLWAVEYQSSNTPGKSLFIHRHAARLFARRLRIILEHVQPHAIISTHPFLSYEVLQVLEQCSSHIPFVMMLGEIMCIHALWLTERRAAVNLAPTHEIYAQALKAGFAVERLQPIGWPVRRQFYGLDGSMRAEILTRLHLNPDRFTIFLQGGGDGVASFEQAVEYVLAACEQAQIILATGTNSTLRRHFQYRKNVYPLPFTREIAPFMVAADVVMGKAGPNALFEAVTLGKPFIATAYLPGQEEPNLEFIQRHELGWIALQPEEQRQLISMLASTPSRLHAIAARVDLYRRWNTAVNENIVPLIHALVR